MKRNRLSLKIKKEKDKDSFSNSKQAGNIYQTSNILKTNGIVNQKSTFYQVLYSKRAPNKKRHNRKFLDGVLEVIENRLILYSEDGKVISKDRRKVSGEMLESGSEFCVGYYDIELDCPLEEEKFRSGECFINLQGSSASPSQKCHYLTKNIVMRQSNAFKSKVENKKPMYDSAAPGAIVLNQNNENTENQCVPVVVDPYIGGKLRAHQIEGVRFLYDCVMGVNDAGQTGAILADEMGLGKTIQIIALIWTLLKQGSQGQGGSIKKVIVVCPSTLVSNWSKEVRKWLGSERLQTMDLHPCKNANNKIQDFVNSRRYPMLIVSYETLRGFVDQLTGVADLLVCDEGHRLKSSAVSNKTVQALLSLNCARRIILTGTPIQNNMKEFFCLMDFVNPACLGTSLQFKRLYEDPINASREPNASQESKRLGEERSRGLQMLINKYMLRRTAEINKKFLPPLSQYVLFCPISQTQVELYQAVVQNNKLTKLMTSFGDNQASILKYITYLKKICNHPRILSNDDMLEIIGSENVKSRFEIAWQSKIEMEETSGKFRCLAEIIKQVAIVKQQKIVVVSTSTSALDCINEFCLRHQICMVRIDGSTEVSERQNLVDNFNSGGEQGEVFLLSTRAGGAGLNLTGASRLVLYDSDWNPAMDQQAMARIWRDGQKNPCVIYRMLTTGTIEEKIYQRQVLKQDLAHLMQDMPQGSNQQFTREELRKLVHLNQSSVCDTFDLLKAKGLDSQSDWLSCSEWQVCEDEVLKNAMQSGYVGYVQVVQAGKNDTDKPVENNNQVVEQNSLGEKYCEVLDANEVTSQGNDVNQIVENTSLVDDTDEAVENVDEGGDSN